MKAISCYTGTTSVLSSSVSSSVYTIGRISSGGGGGGGGSSSPVATRTPSPTPVATATPSVVPTPAVGGGEKTLQERVQASSLPRTTVLGTADWAQKCAQDLRQAGVINADVNGDFRGNASITREEATKMIVLASGKLISWIKEPTATFKDVKNTDWAFPYVETASVLQWITGYEGGLFKPEKSITRAESVKILLLAGGMSIQKGLISKFTDVKSGDWYYDVVTTGFEKNIVKGYADGTFRPNNNVTRNEFAIMVCTVFGA